MIGFNIVTAFLIAAASQKSVEATGNDLAGLLKSLREVSKQLETVSQFVETEQSINDPSDKNPKDLPATKSDKSNTDSDVIRKIETFRRTLEDEKSYHRNNYHKLELSVSRLDGEMADLKVEKLQEAAQGQHLAERLDELVKKQDDSETDTRAQIDALRQTIDDVTKDNKRLAAEVADVKKDMVQESVLTQQLVKRLDDLVRKQEVSRTDASVQMNALRRNIDDVATENKRLADMANRTANRNTRRIDWLVEIVEKMKRDFAPIKETTQQIVGISRGLERLFRPSV